MTTQRVSNIPTLPQVTGRRLEWNAASRRGGPEQGPDVGFDDMNIPGWSEYVEARSAALRRFSYPKEIQTVP